VVARTSSCDAYNGVNKCERLIGEIENWSKSKAGIYTCLYSRDEYIYIYWVNEGK